MTESIRPRSAFIVDDEYLVAFDIEASMREIGFEACIVASNENDAIDLAKSSRPDVVVMDVYLGGTRGSEAARISGMSAFESNADMKGRCEKTPFLNP